MTNVTKSPNGYYYKKINGVNTRVPAPVKELVQGSLKEIFRYVRQALIIDGSPDQEACGILEKGSGMYTCLMTNKGTTNKNGRPMCLQPKADYLWHTHPRNSKIFPSKEDVVMLLRRVVKKSVIFTLHGFWVMDKNVEKHVIIDKGDYYHKLMMRLEKENGKLYYAPVTNRGKEYNESVFRQYSEGVHRAMDGKVTIKFYAF